MIRCEEITQTNFSFIVENIERKCDLRATKVIANAELQKYREFIDFSWTRQSTDRSPMSLCISAFFTSPP